MFLCQYNSFKILIGFRSICSLLVLCAYNHIQNSFPDMVLKSVLQFCFLSLMPVSPNLIGAILKPSTTSWRGKAMPLIGPLPHGCFFFSEKSKQYLGSNSLWTPRAADFSSPATFWSVIYELILFLKYFATSSMKSQHTLTLGLLPTIFLETQF